MASSGTRYGALPSADDTKSSAALLRCSGRGSVCAELPLVLLVLFVMIGFPLFDLAAIGLRFAFVRYACEVGARDAACAPTFVNNNHSALSATNTAKRTVQGICSKFMGIQLRNVETTVIGLPMIPEKMQFETNQPIVAPDISTYLYQYRVKVTAEIEPLITYNGNLFGKVPGLSAPLALTCRMERVCEKPEGLIQ